MGDRVRIVRMMPTSDPLGLVQDWLDVVEEKLDDQPFPLTTKDGVGHLSDHQDHDGIYACYKASKLLATQNPTLSTALWDNAELMVDVIYDTYEAFRLGPTTSPPPFSATGYYNYNLGPRMMAIDPSTTAAVAAKAGTMAANYPRGAAFAGSHSGLPISYIHIFDNYTWPSSDIPPDPPEWDPAIRKPYDARERVLGILSHLVVDDDFSTYEQRTGWPPTGNWVDSHSLFMPRMVARWILGIPEASGIYHQWQAIQADLVAAGGDWSLVPETWRNLPPDRPTSATYGFSSFEFYQIARALIYYYEDPLDDTYNAAILAMITDLCDWLLLYWQKVSVRGNNCLMYRINAEPPYEDPGAPDNALMQMPMFAWLYSKIGGSQYYQMAVDLTRAGIDTTDTEWLWGSAKHFNEKILWAYDGFQWLGWTTTPFTVFWK